MLIRKAATVSIDDFYLTAEEQVNVSQVCCLLVSVYALSSMLTHYVVLGKTKRQQPRELAFGGKQ